MLVGAGALGATDEVLEVAELLGAGVAKALLGKAVRARRRARSCTGSIGLLGTKPSLGPDDGLRHAAAGRHRASRTPSSCPRRARRAPCRSTSTAGMVGMRYPIEVGLVGDAAETLRALLPLLDAQRRRRVARGDRGRRRASGRS